MPRNPTASLIVAGILFTSIGSISHAAISISGVGTHANPTGSNEGLSGICYVGGTQYYAVDDSGGLMQPATISVNPSSGAITAATFGSPVTLGGSDLEGIDYNAVNNSLMVSDETGATIKEYSLSGSYRSAVTVPSVFTSYRANYSLESFTIRGDGLEMWTCNEEALYDTSPSVDDGPLSTASAGTVVRLQRFARNSVHDTWIADGQWAYLTESFGADSGFTSAERSGVSDLCVLPDRTLLVLERTLGYSSLIPHFENRIYEIDFTGATDISAITSLNGATYTRVTKHQLWSGSFSTTYNFEGLCLGPRLDGDALNLMMIADGDGDQDNGLYALRLTGLTTRQLTVTTPIYGTAEPVGGPYRYVAGTTITNSISHRLISQDGRYYECTGWSVTGGYTPSSGSGTNMIMTLTDDAVLTWNWHEVQNTTNTLNYVETFESYTNGYMMPGSNGWSAAAFDDAMVTTNATSIQALQAYSSDCGYSVVTDDRAKALNVAGTVTNTFNIDTNLVIWVDQMMKADTRDAVDTHLLALTQGAFAFSANSHPKVWHYDIAGSSNRWSEISSVTIAPDTWVRVTFKLDYQTHDGTHSYFQVRINGELLTHTQAWSANDGSGIPGGSWFAIGGLPAKLNQLVYDAENSDIDDVVVTTTDPFAAPGARGSMFTIK